MNWEREFENLVNYEECKTNIPENCFEDGFENLVNYEECKTGASK